MRHYLAGFNVTNLDLDSLGYFMDGDDTAAAIEEMVHEAWRLSVRRSIREGSKVELTQDDLMSTCLDRMIGPATSLELLEPEVRLKVAIHECGHALLALKLNLPLMLITIRPTRGGIFGQTQVGGGVVLSVLRGYWEDRLTVVYGGMVAEDLCDIRASTLSGDMSVAANILTRLADHEGKGLPFAIEDIHHNVQNRLSGELLTKSDATITKLARRAIKKARRAMRGVSSLDLERIALRLVAKTTMAGPEFEALAREILSADWFPANRVSGDFKVEKLELEDDYEDDEDNY
jgi:ATP-dependent Zn protease